MTLVFQCRSCRIIVGDSLSIVATHEALSAMTLSRVASLSTSEEQTFDGGNAFRALHCVGCTARVGRVYFETVPELEPVRGYYTLDTDAICSYELAAPPGEAQTYELAAPPGEAHDRSVAPSVEAELRAELHKVQGVILSLHERLLAVERRG